MTDKLLHRDEYIDERIDERTDGRIDERTDRRVFITTYGCQMNVYDSSQLWNIMRRYGWRKAASAEEADFIFVNTCSIREKAAQRVISHLNRLKAQKKKNPGLVIGVGGCVAEQEGADLIKQIPWLNLVIGPGRLSEIPEVLERLPSDPSPVVLCGQSQSRTAIPMVNRPPSESKQMEAKPKPDKAPVSAFLTIMQGCDNYCAYCVVPYLRGPEISRPQEEIIAEAKELIDCGAKEITLLGQNVNSYGRKGHRGGEDFVSLLTKISSLAGLERLRFTTSHPKDFPSRLVDLFGALGPLCEHIHLPVQAGSDDILKAMGRRYDRARYLELIDSLRKTCPNIALSTDVIVGFPGETQRDFEDTVSLLEAVRFDFIFSFKYSDRPMTKAKDLGDKISEEEKSRRLDIVQSIQKEITLSIHRNLIGQTLEVLVEGHARRQGQLTGRSRTLKLINFFGPPSLIGRLVMVTITEAWPVSLLGTIAQTIDAKLA
ncbi:MAG: tRNA (N6-isopentenyl adenosine(37)-C2)-methylthiotransferase MiaB [Deltaproteobacteria bacterium]|jgi:tRNA-2-methylthio-N6-dimethylallyladenosine synthase|nr:tRNA (N6-isopentenyl adenosine(37)-C2)-methylthiotransferase MiaB [Deltaproteobacteria bacterium]